MKKDKKQNPDGILSAFLSALTAVIVMLLVIYGANYVIRERYLVVEVVGDSMMNTLESGDIVYSDSNAEIKRGDIVIVDVSDQPEFSKIGTDIIIKRVIAVAGDSIKCNKTEGVVYLSIDGGEYEPLQETYIEGQNLVSFECTLAEGQIYVMGDNRQNSMDSRTVGPLSVEKVLGTVPEWVLEQKTVIKGWEGFNDLLFGWMKR